jgi:hypothetical protein
MVKDERDVWWQNGMEECDGQFSYLPPCGWLALLLKETFRIKSANSTWRISIYSISNR